MRAWSCEARVCASGCVLGVVAAVTVGVLGLSLAFVLWAVGDVGGFWSDDGMGEVEVGVSLGCGDMLAGGGFVVNFGWDRTAARVECVLRLYLCFPLKGRKILVGSHRTGLHWQCYVNYSTSCLEWRA